MNGLGASANKTALLFFGMRPRIAHYCAQSAQMGCQLFLTKGINHRIYFVKQYAIKAPNPFSKMTASINQFLQFLNLWFRYVKGISQLETNRHLHSQHLAEPANN